MRRGGSPVPVAALLSAVFAATAAAQGTARDAFLSSPATGAPAGNPLWAIPLGDLAETRARPLFSLSRRPPAAPVLAALPAPPPDRTPPSKPEPDHPLLTLLGTIVGEAMEIGVFADEASHDVIRLKVGEVHEGWTLSSVVGRAAFFQKQGYRAATLALPAPGAEVTQPATRGNGQTAGVPPPFVPPVIPASVKGGSTRPPREG
jgi:general secretion pathway protein N